MKFGHSRYPGADHATDIRLHVCVATCHKQEREREKARIGGSESTVAHDSRFCGVWESRSPYTESDESETMSVPGMGVVL